MPAWTLVSLITSQVDDIRQIAYRPASEETRLPVRQAGKSPSVHSQCVLVSSPASAWCLTEEERSWAVQRKRTADEAAAAADPASTCAWRAAPMCPSAAMLQPC